jgi:hypothetical protein
LIVVLPSRFFAWSVFTLFNVVVIMQMNARAVISPLFQFVCSLDHYIALFDAAPLFQTLESKVDASKFLLTPHLSQS